MTILVTGASGFIGSFVVEEALRRGYDTWAAVRATSSRAFLTDSRIHFIELDLDSEDALVAALAGHQFDYIVHAAGATKARHADEFYRTNTAGTQHLVRALLRVAMPVRRFILLSSLSVCGALHEQPPYEALRADDAPQPHTHYGRSKWLAEQYLATVAEELNYIILRPTGVYGPREKDYFLMVQSLCRHTNLSVGRAPQRLTFVYVSDLVQAIFAALTGGVRGSVYLLSDGNDYDSALFAQLVCEELSLRHILSLRLPLALVRAVCRLCDVWGRATGAMTALNNDKYHILAQRNWRCDILPAQQELGYAPQVPLREGVSKTIEWYKQAGWI